MSEHCGISASEERTWDAATLAFRLLDQRVERDVQQEVDLPLTYYELLVLLSRNEHGSLRMSDLAELTHTRASRISHAVRKLAEAGLVDRVHCEEDRRSWFAVLTDKARGVLRDAGARHVVSMRENLFDVLSAEQRDQLLDISRTLLARLAPESALAREGVPTREESDALAREGAGRAGTGGGAGHGGASGTGTAGGAAGPGTPEGAGARG
ncbi:MULTISPECIES: MarR family winged helix-turn-helix transcriptional regulator [Nocardiopsidaceae]|uniref:MarR family transcriptional regulator n=1 Tax=Streptomonospora nanhaiensis TaxID=1323731 RepID=A0ABY6YQ05_9ACTN|nr:MarR family transcriptional regulator [Streptomonospora nanhaiensis]WAE74313.1 MarR family transcriptional regulator [Streptomonospora nanhaiensis]